MDRPLGGWAAFSGRFDIGIRLSGDVAKDMIALRIDADMRRVAGSSWTGATSLWMPQSPDMDWRGCLTTWLLSISPPATS